MIGAMYEKKIKHFTSHTDTKVEGWRNLLTINYSKSVYIVTTLYIGGVGFRLPYSSNYIIKNIA
jgi:hypothetical protein